MSHRIPLAPFNPSTIPEITTEGILWMYQVRAKSVDIRVLEFTFDPASIAANTTVEQSTTITGLKTVDYILRIIKPTLDAGNAVGQGRVSATDTLAITYINASGGAVDPGSETYTLIYIKNSR